ncbi:unnamed protein product [Oikopleura dioica]|uniref:Uncharacterized protein n=1 Tax=Oikopleura dioica TaxID=34765 RepID=E4X0Q8_OIKDI|nr:unnamed protein product [Oikopleura dioica]
MFNKSKSKRNFRKRRTEVNEEEPENSQVYEVENGLELAKLKRELKKRTAGVNSESLAKGVKTPRFDDPNDPYKLNSGGGLTQIREKRLGNNEKDVTQISSTFKTEKKIRDEEEEMNKFIESEILKRRGIESATKESMKQNLRLEDIVDPKFLYEIPEKYRATSKHLREDGLLSAQMLSGIPEVDLGVNNKLQNIERTEAAKRLLVDKFIKDEKEASSDKSHERSYAREAAVNRGGNEFTDQFYSQHMRFYKGEEAETDAVKKIRTQTGEWKIKTREGKYGEEKLVGGIHGGDRAVGEADSEVDKEIYKRFRLTEGADVEKSVDTTGHRI